jgi:hypothetical protein
LAVANSVVGLRVVLIVPVVNRFCRLRMIDHHRNDRRHCAPLHRRFPQNCGTGQHALEAGTVSSLLCCACFHVRCLIENFRRELQYRRECLAMSCLQFVPVRFVPTIRDFPKKVENWNRDLSCL